MGLLNRVISFSLFMYDLLFLLIFVSILHIYILFHKIFSSFNILFYEDTRAKRGVYIYKLAKEQNI
jgi:hypothetical protein